LSVAILEDDSELEGRMVVYAVHRNSLMGVVPMVFMRCRVSWRRNVTNKRDGILVVLGEVCYWGMFQVVVLWELKGERKGVHRMTKFTASLLGKSRSRSRRESRRENRRENLSNNKYALFHSAGTTLLMRHVGALSSF
jgi:hypothetical protein